jgi:hypothetical protein
LHALLLSHLDKQGAQNVTFIALPVDATIERMNDELLDAAGLMRKSALLRAVPVMRPWPGSPHADAPGADPLLPPRGR